MDGSVIEAEYYSAVDRFDDMWKEKRDRQYISATVLTELILGNLGVELPDNSKDMIVQGFEEVILEKLPPLIDNADTVLELLHKRYKVGLISNTGVTPGRILRRVLKSHEILQYFDCTVFSDEVGYTKPHPVIFEKAVEELQVIESETVHVGDLLETDIAGAKAMGMKTVWFNAAGTGSSECRIEFAPDYEIKTLPQLLAIT